ncbi:unnamed protein product [Didymodactylos carnosus]|uniref:NAD(+)--protein-arginine ADP-ribosyltransferase n=1 Tax=Didymodactylos carnosus TaxID=1234261 RepID=A0A814LMK0_9BILA|nr:unnamed protein product [Didymodactylos carnosus]CAF1176830.1 unnamed protein product [Didymodactylos carnosus]CAF3833389.1 unnamed protein product [Didymodactylos carnosus]CAF3988113.1 unnamed protein product [Didymodactylos carnosus]
MLFSVLNLFLCSLYTHDVVADPLTIREQNIAQIKQDREKIKEFTLEEANKYDISEVTPEDFIYSFETIVDDSMSDFEFYQLRKKGLTDYEYRFQIKMEYGLIMKRILRSRSDNTLTVFEQIAIMFYTGPPYLLINHILRIGNIQIEHKPFLHALITGLSKLPVITSKENGPLYREDVMEQCRLREHQVGKIVLYTGITSTTKLQSIKGREMKCNIILQEYRTARSIKHLSLDHTKHQEEFVFVPGTIFEVMKKEQTRDGSSKIFMEERLITEL